MVREPRGFGAMSTGDDESSRQGGPVASHSGTDDDTDDDMPILVDWDSSDDEAPARPRSWQSGSEEESDEEDHDPGIGGRPGGGVDPGPVHGWTGQSLMDRYGSGVVTGAPRRVAQGKKSGAARTGAHEKQRALRGIVAALREAGMRPTNGSSLVELSSQIQDACWRALELHWTDSQVRQALHWASTAHRVLGEWLALRCSGGQSKRSPKETKVFCELGLWVAILGAYARGTFLPTSSTKFCANPRNFRRSSVEIVRSCCLCLRLKMIRTPCYTSLFPTEVGPGTQGSPPLAANAGARRPLVF